jgi:hypothetical protein
LPNQTPDGDQFEEFAPHDQGFSLLRTSRQTFRWYLRASIIPMLVLVLVVGVGYGDLNKHHSNLVPATTSTTQPPATTTTTPPVTTTTVHHPVTTTTTHRKPPVTTTTVHHPVTTTTTHRKPPVTTTTVHHPVTTTTTHRKPPVTTTTVHVTTGTYKISFTCSGGQSVTVSGTGPTASNTLTVTGPSAYSASGTTATVWFTALAGTYVAIDHDSNGGTYINYASGGQATSCS